MLGCLFEATFGPPKYGAAVTVRGTLLFKPAHVFTLSTMSREKLCEIAIYLTMPSVRRHLDVGNESMTLCRTHHRFVSFYRPKFQSPWYPLPCKPLHLRGFNSRSILSRLLSWLQGISLPLSDAGGYFLLTLHDKHRFILPNFFIRLKLVPFPS